MMSGKAQALNASWTYQMRVHVPFTFPLAGVAGAFLALTLQSFETSNSILHFITLFECG